MSHVHRLRDADRILIERAKLEFKEKPAAQEPRRGYPLMPDDWHALIRTGHPMAISQAMQDVKEKPQEPSRGYPLPGSAGRGRRNTSRNPRKVRERLLRFEDSQRSRR